FREQSTMTTVDDSGNKKVLDCNERYYTPSEITWLLKSLGFKKIDIHGSQLGKFSREDNLTTDNFEMLVIAEK
ncbi:class I SAM-dependent methyltransferase, partial [candidate division KSB1 bacterium]|nr:class I SAM-dependent methyltransferase [candidate division KSB1 bacterium]